MEAVQGKINKVSMVVPCYNASRTLASCLRALKGQSFQPAEIIVVDDCSADDSAEIARIEGADVVQLPLNRGAAAARNAGAKKAIGDVIFFVDSDVVLSPDALERVAARFGEPDSPDAVIGIYSPDQPDAGFVSNVHNLFTYCNHDREEGRIDWFWGAIGAIWKDVFQRMGGFDETYTGAAAEDIEFGWRMARNGFRCVIEKNIVGEHKAELTFVRAVKNDFKKGTYGIPFYLSHNREFKMKYGFTKTANFMSLSAAGLSVAGLLATPLVGIAGLKIVCLAIAIFIVMNVNFLRYLSQQRGPMFAAAALPVYFTFFLSIGFGIVWSVVELIRGKT